MLSKNLLLVILLAIFFEAKADPIEDNSFLLEEAYNQETGVVQFIQATQFSKNNDEKNVTYSFTNEIPVIDQSHQFSYVIPVLKTKTSSDSNSGIGDVLLNYRYQLLNTETVAVAPRFSFILPTGKTKEGFGNGALGYQTNTAMSVKLSEKFVSHWNFGFTYTPSAKNEFGGKKENLFCTNFGSSLIYLMTDKLNFLVEFVQASNEIIDESGVKSREESYYINPGVRGAIDFTNTQIVPGISFPIGIGPSKSDDYSVLVYFSVEPKLW